MGCNFIQNYNLQKIGQGVMQNIRQQLFGQMLRMPMNFFDQNPVGKLVTRVTNDTSNLSELFSSGFVMLLGDILLIVGVMAAMLSMHWKLGLLALSVFPLMIAAMVFFSNRLRIAFRRSRELLSKLNAFFAERVSGMSIVQLMGREDYERKVYCELSDEYRDRQSDGVFLYALLHPAITILSAVSMGLVIWYGPQYVMNGELPLGTIVSFFAYVQLLYQPVRNITDRYNIFLAAMASAERIFTLLDMQEETGLRETAPRPNRQTSLGTLEFDHVSFSYQSEKKEPILALQDVSFSIREGEKVAIVGHTGAGKTTITSLLFRFYEQQSGVIRLGGQDIRTLSKRELRERIGFVQQDVFLFAGTIQENLVLLRQNITPAELSKACEATGFQRVLDRLPDGLNTYLEERGSNLSLGERQILAFTRVFLQRPSLLVLDEATSSIDRVAELQIQKATEELVRGRSSLIIAHRLSTIREADRILVFERGRLESFGTHSELVKQSGVYGRFVALQDSAGSLTGAQSTSVI
jgi:ATP-binding cassette subfamily B protein